MPVILPPSPFAIVVTPPATIEVGTTPQSLQFNVANPPPPAAAVTFRGGRRPAPIGPDRSAADSLGDAPDCFYVYCLWGDGISALCSSGAARTIAVVPATANQDWTCGPMTDPVMGPYWILYSPNGATLDPGQSIAFDMTGIVCDAPAGMCLIYLQSQLAAYQQNTASGQIFKTAAGGSGTAAGG